MQVQEEVMNELNEVVVELQEWKQDHQTNYQ
jgi:uncharacterized coiled-coil protein SlyX